MALTQARLDEMARNYGNFFLSKKFYVVTPFRKRIPLSEVCNHLPLKTMGDLGEHGRLVLVVECDTANPDGTETIYWKQAFYFSTGTSSGMKNTWLPFDGIVFGGPNDLDADEPFGLKPMPGDVVNITNQVWLDKSPFLSKRLGKASAMTPEDERLAAELYDGGFLPEPFFFDRIGWFSHAMASYMLGGDYWSAGGPSVSALGGTGNPGMSELAQMLRPPRPALPCFVEMVTTPDRLPFSDIAGVNGYIARNKAVSYMAPFWGTPVEEVIPPPAGLSVTVSYDKKSYSIPLYVLVFELRFKLQALLVSMRSEKVADDLDTAVRGIVNSLGGMPILSERPDWNLLKKIDNFRFVIMKRQGHQAHLFGGRRGKTLRKKRKTRKGKSHRRQI